VQECGVSGQKYTYAQAKDACHYISRSLHNIGLKKGDVIALVGPNYPDIILSFLGSVTGGFIVTTVNPQYTTGKPLYISSLFLKYTTYVYLIISLTIVQQISGRIRTKFV